MARLIHFAITSLDGYIADEDGAFDWSTPDEEVHAFINDLVRPFGTHLYGRRMYEVMAVWETWHTLPEQPAVMLDFARIWQAADKVVYSTTLEAVSTARTRLEQSFDPEAVRRMKAEAQQDLMVGGARLAAHMIKAGLVDEWRLILAPVIVGGGTHLLPGGVRVGLELQDECRFDNGMVYLRYRTKP